MPEPDPTDVHAGATPAEHLSAFAAVFAAVTEQGERLGLRPSTVSVSALFGLLSVVVGLPESNVAGVDALADMYGLPTDDGSSRELYARRGRTTIGGTVTLEFHLDVYTSRPRPAAEVAVLVAEPVERSTREVPAITAAPVRVSAERAVAVDRMTLIRAWVAANYSTESKRLVLEGAEATPEDQAKFAAADASGLFAERAVAVLA